MAHCETCGGFDRKPGEGQCWSCRCRFHSDEVARELEALRAENKRLRTALERIVNEEDDGSPFSEWTKSRATAALKEQRP